MGRKRISPERAIQIYGSLERYEKHCQYMKDYNIRHAEEQAAWREENKEHLIITSVIGSELSEVAVNDFTLTIQSLNDPDCYWLDSGEFNINIKAGR